jgi:hypothetical protein
LLKQLYLFAQDALDYFTTGPLVFRCNSINLLNQMLGHRDRDGPHVLCSLVWHLDKM